MNSRTIPNFKLFAIAGAVLAVALSMIPWSAEAESRVVEQSAPAPKFDGEFWQYWGDGKAEIGTYDLKFNRYGELRSGVAVAIFVTEDFGSREMVKADLPVPANEKFPVLKLNLVQDYPTGIYDYNMMTSTFVNLADHQGRAAGSVAKVAFSSQEWCGHTYHQLVFRDGQVEETLHSYFGGEADQDRDFRAVGAVSEDVLFHWARGFAGPVVSPGDAVDGMVLRSLESARLNHQRVEPLKATFQRSVETSTVEVPAGTFTCEQRVCRIDDHVTWTFDVERESPHRIVRWSASDGRSAELVKAVRIAYWNLNGQQGTDALPRIGLQKRPARTP